jgi:hypothetical protein
LSAEVEMGSFPGSRLGWALAAWAVPAAANAQMALSMGTDGGITLPDADIRFVDPATQRPNPTPTLALGIDVAGYYVPSDHVAVGFAFSPTLYGAGPEPSPGLDFALGPRFVWRGGRAHVAADAAFVVATFDDRCSFERSEVRFGCPPTRGHEPAGPGWGVGLAPLIRVATFAETTHLLVGPAFRYQVARFDGPDDDLVLRKLQAVVAVHVFVDLTE